MTDKNGIDKVFEVINKLLGPQGCPWDREQTPESLCDYLVEETFELTSAIRSGNIREIHEEMGDVLFLLLFIARLLQESMSLDQILKESSRKMIRRHPHVFADRDIHSRKELVQSWEKIKKTEKSHVGRYLLETIPKGLPPLLQAYRMHSKAAGAGFTWSDANEVEKQLNAEWGEWLSSRSSGETKKMEEEFGDYFFTLVEYARRHNIKANSALGRANAKFARRVRIMEDLARDKGKELSDMDGHELENLWGQAKLADS